MGRRSLCCEPEEPCDELSSKGQFRFVPTLWYPDGHDKFTNWGFLRQSHLPTDHHDSEHQLQSLLLVLGSEAMHNAHLRAAQTFRRKCILQRRFFQTSRFVEMESILRVVQFRTVLIFVCLYSGELSIKDNYLL